MRGATMRAVQDLLGHGSMAMVLRYAHLRPDARRDAIRLLDRAEPTSKPIHAANQSLPSSLPGRGERI